MVSCHSSKIRFGFIEHPFDLDSGLDLFIVTNFLEGTPLSCVDPVCWLWRCSHNVALVLCAFVHWWWLEHHGWAELALRPQLLAEQIEADRNGNHGGGETAKQSSRPLDAEVIEHLSREERESGSHKRSKESVCRDGGGSAIGSHVVSEANLVKSAIG
jgi:hypothetical protein